MKKMFISVIALAMSVMALATETAYVQIKLTGESGGASSVFLTEDDAYTNAYESGADVEKMMSQSNSKSVLMYGFVGTTPCEDVVAANLDGLVLGFTTNQLDQNYTLKFIDYEGSKTLTLYDRVTKTPTVITDGGSYNFSVTAAEVGRVAINDRFVINYVAPSYVIMKGDFENPDGDCDYTSNFTDNGTSFSLTLDLEANTWYHFQLEEGYSPAIVAANGSAFNRDNNSYYIPVDGWHAQLTLYADAADTYTFTWNDLTDNLTITFPDLVEVTTNAYGLATFSYASDLQVVESGAKLYKGDLDGETLVLTQVDYVKADEGVIVYNEAGTATTYHFNAGTGTSSFDGNELLPASAWNATHTGYDIYVLSGSSLYLYEGTSMKPNKAYLKVAQNPYAGAPKHISFRFNQPTAIESAEAAELKAEKFVENGVIYIRRGNEVFNLQGQKVNF